MTTQAERQKDKKMKDNEHLDDLQWTTKIKNGGRGGSGIKIFWSMEHNDSLI